MPHEPRLRPREHGAYAMLLFPVVSGLAMGGLSWAGIAFAGLAVTGFLAHESILVVRGARGERIRSAQHKQPARTVFEHSHAPIHSQAKNAFKTSEQTTHPNRREVC